MRRVIHTLGVVALDVVSHVGVDDHADDDSVGRTYRDGSDHGRHAASAERSA